MHISTALYIALQRCRCALPVAHSSFKVLCLSDMGVCVCPILSPCLSFMSHPLMWSPSRKVDLGGSGMKAEWMEWEAQLRATLSHHADYLQSIQVTVQL